MSILFLDEEIKEIKFTLKDYTSRKPCTCHFFECHCKKETQYAIFKKKCCES